jgi:hypothetical protein
MLIPTSVTSANGANGANGATGATGPQGPAGPPTAGPSGLNLTVVESTQSVSAGNIGALTLTCPAAEPYVTGGGSDWDVHNPPGGPYISGSFPETFVFPQVWRVVADNPTGSGIDPDTLFGYAICSS